MGQTVKRADDQRFKRSQEFQRSINMSSFCCTRLHALSVNSYAAPWAALS